MEHSEIIRQIRKKLKLSQQKFADYIGVKGSTINHIEGGRSSITPEMADKIVEKLPELGLTVNKILSGEIEADLNSVVAKDLPKTTTNQEDCVNIPLIRASAGHGAYNYESEQLSVSKFELIQLGYKRFEKLIGVQIYNNSMYPTINDGDLLVCDKNVDFNFIRDKYIYVLRYGETYFCKRLLCGLKSVTIKSDNPDYPPETILESEIDQLEIIGRVVMRISVFKG